MNFMFLKSKKNRLKKLDLELLSYLSTAHFKDGPEFFNRYLEYCQSRIKNYNLDVDIKSINVDFLTIFLDQLFENNHFITRPQFIFFKEAVKYFNLPKREGIFYKAKYYYYLSMLSKLPIEKIRCFKYNKFNSQESKILDIEKDCIWLEPISQLNIYYTSSEKSYRPKATLYKRNEHGDLKELNTPLNYGRLLKGGVQIKAEGLYYIYLNDNHKIKRNYLIPMSDVKYISYQKCAVEAYPLSITLYGCDKEILLSMIVYQNALLFIKLLSQLISK